MALNLTNPGLAYPQPDGVDPTTGANVNIPSLLKFFKNDALRSKQFAKDSSQAVHPSISTVDGQIGAPEISPAPMQNAGDVVAGPDQTKVGMQEQPTSPLPQFFKPKFSDTTVGQNGLPAPINPAQTKLGKLLTIVKAATEGGLAGSQAGTFGGGYQAAKEAPYQNLNMQLGAENAILQNQSQRAQIGMLPWQRAAKIQELQKGAYITPRTGGVFDVRTGKYVPGAAPPDKEGNVDQQTFDYLTSHPDPSLGRNLTPPEAMAYIAQQKQDTKPDANPTEAALAVKAANGDVQAEKALKRLDQSRREARPPKIDDTTQQAIEAAAQAIAPMDPKDLSRLKDISSMRGDQRLLIYNRAKQINPAFSPTVIDRRAKTIDDYTNKSEGNQLQSFGTFLEHAGEASKITNQFRSTSSKLVNSPLNKIKNQFGDAPYIQFISALEPVRKEFEGFLLGGRALYGDDRAAAEKILSDDSSPAQIQAALKQMGHTVKARYNELNQRFKNSMGGTGIEDVIGPMSPEALSGAQQIGVSMGSGSSTVPTGTPDTHVFSVGAWQKANPRGDVNAATAAAKAQNYTVTP